MKTFRLFFSIIALTCVSCSTEYGLFLSQDGSVTPVTNNLNYTVSANSFAIQLHTDTCQQALSVQITKHPELYKAVSSGKPFDQLEAFAPGNAMAISFENEDKEIIMRDSAVSVWVYFSQHENSFDMQSIRKNKMILQRTLTQIRKYPFKAGSSQKIGEIKNEQYFMFVRHEKKCNKTWEILADYYFILNFN